MSFDGIFTHEMVQELHDLLATGRLSKIQQPFEHELVLTIRAHSKNHSLLLSANPSYARAQITDVKFKSPHTPSNFVMTFRKNLDGAIVKDIYQIKNDRIMVIEFQNRNELGDQQLIDLYVEIMNRHSNIILVHQNNGEIIDSIKHISENQDRYRELLPKVTYKLPPEQKQVSPFDSFEREKFVKSNLKEIIADDDVQLKKLLQGYFMGIGKDSANELVYQIGQIDQDEHAILKAFDSFFDELQSPIPTIYTKNNKQIFTPIKYQNLINNGYSKQEFDSLSTMLDDFYNDRARKDRVRQQASNVLQVINRNLKRSRTKIKRLNKDLAKTESADKYRIKGEILTTYMNKVKQGQSKITLDNFYDNNNPININLQPDLTPSENAQKYFKTYQKLKNSISHLQQQIKVTQSDIDYLESIIAQMDYADPQDIDDIRSELIQQGYIKKQKKRKNKRIKPKSGEIFLSSDGTKIHVGKNNIQNDFLTTKFADKRYVWLHIKNLPGSHVIIETLKPTQKTILEAAGLAAYYSKVGASGSRVPIDYTLDKYVHKPNGAKPGFVIYTHQKTLIVDPNNNLKKA